MMSVITGSGFLKNFCLRDETAIKYQRGYDFMSEKNDLGTLPEHENVENVSEKGFEGNLQQNNGTVCPACGAFVPSYMSSCPNCLTLLPDNAAPNENINHEDNNSVKKKTNKKKIIIPIVSVVAVAIIAVGAFFGIKVYKEKKIEYYLSEVDIAYSEFDFDKLSECYDSLEKLGYDITSQREILDYDRKAYPAANNYYTTLKDTYDKLENNSFNTVRELLNDLSAVTNALMETEINTDSKIGTYIQNVQQNPMFSALKTTYLDNSDIDVDNGLVSSGHRMLLKIDIEFILKTEFPYSKSESNSDSEQKTEDKTGTDKSADETSFENSDAFIEAKKEQQKTAFSMLKQYLTSKGMSDNDVIWICESDTQEDKFACCVESGKYAKDDIEGDLLVFLGTLPNTYDYYIPMKTIFLYSGWIYVYEGGDHVDIEFCYYKYDRNLNVHVNDSSIPGDFRNGLYDIKADIDMSSYVKSSYLDLEFNPTYGISQSDKNDMCQYAAAILNKSLDCIDDLLNEIGLSLKDIGFESYVS